MVFGSSVFRNVLGLQSPATQKSSQSRPLTVIVVSSKLIHSPVVTVQRRVYSPTLNPDTSVLRSVASEKIGSGAPAGLDTTVHSPVLATPGLLPFIVMVAPIGQDMLWLLPALALIWVDTNTEKVPSITASEHSYSLSRNCPTLPLFATALIVNTYSPSLSKLLITVDELVIVL